MKYSKLKQIVTEKAESLKLSAGYSGAWDDGGSSSLLGKLEDFEQELIIKHDLRPSEYYKLNIVEVGEPDIFQFIIDDYKIKLIKNIKL